MKKTHILKSVCAVGVAAACAWGLAACAPTAQPPGLTGGTAASVNGVDIPEDKVTMYIQNVREQLGASDEDAWGKWLAQNSYTPDSVREQVIDSYIQRELIKSGAQERNVSVDDSEIDDAVNKMKANYDNDDAKWQDALKKAGMSEDEYRQELKIQLESKKLTETFPADDPSEEDLLKYAQMYAKTYDGAKKSSHILFATGDDANAQEVLDKINSGEIDFADAAKQYSKDSSASSGGDVGWDKPDKFVKEYTDALDKLDKGQVSGLVTSQFGIHIIKCTDVFHAPAEVTSTDQIPSEWLDSIKTSLKSQQQQQAYDKYLEDEKSKADININPMPDGLPYYVDMSKYPAPSTGDGSDGSDGSGNQQYQNLAPNDGANPDGSDSPDSGQPDGATPDASSGAAGDGSSAGSSPSGQPDGSSTAGGSSDAQPGSSSGSADSGSSQSSSGESSAG